jgi:phospholipid N-methyltransferase
MNIYENIGRIRIGDLVALKGSTEQDEGPVGIVLSEIVVTSFPVTGRKKVSLEYRCCMIGKNGKMITMTFSERDLVVLSGVGATGPG